MHQTPRKAPSSQGSNPPSVDEVVHLVVGEEDARAAAKPSALLEDVEVQRSHQGTKAAMCPRVHEYPLRQNEKVRDGGHPALSLYTMICIYILHTHTH